MLRKERECIEARELRRRGASIIAIARDLGVARSSVSVWVRDVPLPPPSGHQESIPPEPAEPSLGLRRCGRCCELLSEAGFNRLREGLQHWCRDCFKAYQRERKERNRAQVAAATARRRDRARAQVLVHLAASGCLDCGEPDPVVLEFDHVRPGKVTEVTALTSRGARAEMLATEIARCEVVCASCHRLRTAERSRAFRLIGTECASWPQKSPSQQRAMRYVSADLERRSCVDCGERRPACLDYDHLGDKLATVANLVHGGAANARLAAEIAKCVVRCASCHRRRTEWGRQSWRTRLPTASPQALEKYPHRDSNPSSPP